MRIIERVDEMQREAETWRSRGEKIALAPTMGYLHEGHLALVRRAREAADVVVVSIFVNPTQFGPGEDLERYPRSLERDIKLAGEAGAAVVFTPGAGEMYPDGFQSRVEVLEISRPLCGKSRPVHFQGVATVVAKLFNIVKPHVAVFGEKDYQQLAVIRRMVRDLNMDIDIIGHPIVREPDGLAMSSRNAYLTPESREIALRLSSALGRAREMVSGGEKSAERILLAVRGILETGGGLEVDYAELCHPESLDGAPRLEGPVLLAIAAFVGMTRLIDNCILKPSVTG
jgi:pantoate--beta-alanine ligase